MSFGNSAGVYNQIIDQSAVVSGTGLFSGGIVITASKGPTVPTVVTNPRQFVNLYGYPSRDNPSMYAALRFLRRANLLTVRRVINDAVSASGMSEDSTPETELDVTAANEGTWGNNIVVSFEANTSAPSGVFDLVVVDGETEVERFQVSRDQTAKNGFGISVYIEDVINGKSNYIEVADYPDVGGTEYTETEITLSGGLDDTVVPDDTAIAGAWDDFDNVENISSRYLINAGWATTTVQQKMLAIAQSRRDAFAILDIPLDIADNAQSIVEYRNDTLSADSYHGALYAGWLVVSDVNIGANVSIPCSGDVAANFVQGGTNSEIWEPVFGFALGSIPDVIRTVKNFDEGERDLLYVNGVNPVTKIGTNNCVIWGQKTLQQFASGLDRANVVVNVKDIDVRLYDSLLPFVGRPNVETYRESAGYLVRSFLQNRKDRGGLYDFQVDLSANTPETIDAGEFYIDAFVSPVRGMEYIRTRITVLRTGVSIQ